MPPGGKKLMFDQVLVVCVGNICRSPMGEALLARELHNAGHDRIQVSSAGLSALVGRPADIMAQALMRREGIDISAHRARQLTLDLISGADLILVMETEHRRAVEVMSPSARGKVYRLGEWRKADVPDPYQQSEEIFVHALTLVKHFVADWLPKLARYSAPI